jgi:heme exporter protein C
MQRFANPTRFLKLQRAILPWVAGAAAIMFAIGLYLALVKAPADYQQGETVRIMFVHVPAAWLALMIYTVMASSSIVAIIWRHPLADLAAKAAAPIGAAFTFLALVTGSLWGKPMWGAWWVWDARLTSMFVLLLLYLGYIAIWQAIDDPRRAARIASIVAIVGFINVPIIKFSVEWWNSLHQPASVLRADGPAIHSSILWPLLVMAVAYTLLYIALHLVAIRSELVGHRIRQIELARADAA